MVLEKGAKPGFGVTSRNSGVIHAGLYYAPGSLKAECCIRGNALLYEWCRERGVAHRRTGKWILGDARVDEKDMGAIVANAEASGVQGLRWAKRAELEQVFGTGKEWIGFWSPDTGIIDPHELCDSFIAEAELYGASVFYAASVLSAAVRAGGGYLLETTRGPMDCDLVVNCAGLDSDQVASYVCDRGQRIYPWRGHYFRIHKKLPFDALVYPVKRKNDAGLGIHLTMNLSGQWRAGPDTELIQSKEDFSPPADLEERLLRFNRAIEQWIPGIAVSDLSYDMSGIRPKLRRDEQDTEKDFLIEQSSPGFWSLLGIESPGLTASLALADEVVKRVGGG